MQKTEKEHPEVKRSDFWIIEVKRREKLKENINKWREMEKNRRRQQWD